MTREEELRIALERLDDVILRLTDVVEQMGLLNITFRRLFAQAKSDFDYRTGMPPDAKI